MELRTENEDDRFFPEARAGEEGWAYRHRQVTALNGSTIDLVWVVVRDGSDHRSGFVLSNSLIRGEIRRDPIPIELRPEQLGPVPHSTNLTRQQRDSVLYRTIDGLWRMIRSNRTTVLAPIASQEETDLVDQTLYGPHANHYVDLLYDCTIPEVRKIMDGGKFSAQEFLDPAKRVQRMRKTWPSDEYAVIYTMLTEGVTHGTMRFMDRAPANGSALALYIGQTSNGPDRCFLAGQSHQALLHRPESKAGKSLKYQIHRSGNWKETTWIPLLRIRKSDPRVQALTWKNFLHVAELTFTVLMKSWNPLLQRPASLDQMGSYARDYEASSVFRKLIDEVASTTGWDPAPTVGTNWVTPIFSAMPEDRVWVSWYNADRKAWIFRTRCTIIYDVSPHSKYKALVVKISGRTITLPAKLHNDGDLKYGEGVHL